MKKVYSSLCVVFAMSVISGCVSTVKTYNANGVLTGKCKAFGGAAHCYGYANHSDPIILPSKQTNGVSDLQEIPEKYQISLTN